MEMVERIKKVPIKTTRRLTEDELDEITTLGIMFGVIEYHGAALKDLLDSLGKIDGYTTAANEGLKYLEKLENILDDAVDDFNQTYEECFKEY